MGNLGDLQSQIKCLCRHSECTVSTEVFLPLKNSRNCTLSSVFRVVGGNRQVPVFYLLTAENIREQLNMYREQRDLCQVLLNKFVIQKLSAECKSGMHPFSQYCASVIICLRAIRMFTAFTEAGVCFAETHR